MARETRSEFVANMGKAAHAQNMAKLAPSAAELRRAAQRQNGQSVPRAERFESVFIAIFFCAFLVVSFGICFGPALISTGLISVTVWFYAMLTGCSFSIAGLVYFNRG